MSKPTNKQQIAEQQASVLAEDLNCTTIGGWEAKAWENGSRWCYCAIHHTGIKLYMGDNASEPRFNAYYDPHSIEVGVGDTPLEAIFSLYAHWKKKIDQLQSEIADIEFVVNGEKQCKTKDIQAFSM